MRSFLHTDALNHIEKHLDRFPLIKLDRILDWAPIEQYLAGRKTRYVRDNGGRPAYPLLSMFKAILLGQWHSLSDPELEYSLRPLQNPHLRRISALCAARSFAYLYDMSALAVQLRLELHPHLRVLQRSQAFKLLIK